MSNIQERETFFKEGKQCIKRLEADLVAARETTAKQQSLTNAGLQLIALKDKRIAELEAQLESWMRGTGLILATIPINRTLKASGTFAEAIEYFKQLHTERDEAMRRVASLRDVLKHPFINQIWHWNQETYTPKETDFPQHDSGVFLDAVEQALAACDDQSFVTCPVCNGVCGVDVSVSIKQDDELIDIGQDWHDCDFCDATGKAERAKALTYLNTKIEAE